MRISDWSSDVCSSDLITGIVDGEIAGNRQIGERAAQCARPFHSPLAPTVPPDTLIACEADQRDSRRRVGFHGPHNLVPAKCFRVIDRVDPAVPVVHQSKVSGKTVKKAEKVPSARSEEHTSELQSLMRI